MTDWSEYQDDISDAISDSMDMDWGANDGARAVVRWLNENKPLSAAPAPEGGVAHYGDPCVKCGVGHDDVSPGPCRDDGITISRERANALLSYLKNGRGPAGWPTTLWCEVQAFIKNIEAALAPREEAPAEVGAVQKLIDDLRYVYSQMTPSALERMDSDGAAIIIERAIEHLRSQPPAREDAQPVARSKAVEAMRGAIEWDKERGYRMPYRVRDPLYAAIDAASPHPAPDALRVAVEALKMARDYIHDVTTGGLVSAGNVKAILQGHTVNLDMANADLAAIDQALAALQAEQEGGA